MGKDTVPKRVARIHISRREFDTTVEFIEAARKHGEATIEYAALLLCAVIHYARPFTENERQRKGRPAPLADPRLDGIDLNEVLGSDFELHERIITIRNKAVAHSEETYYPLSEIPPLGVHSGATGVAFSSRSWHILNERFDLDAFARIAESMRRKTLKMMMDYAVTRRASE